MHREPMGSSVIASMGYDASQHLLELEFRATGHIYRYPEVPPEEYAAFLAAESKGIYFNHIFKPRGYRYIRVR